VWKFEQQKWNKVVGGDAAEVGAGPGSYDIDSSVWHVNVSFSSRWSWSLKGFWLTVSCYLVLQSRFQWRKRLGILQRHFWVDKFGYVRLSYIVQFVLDFRDCLLRDPKVQGSQGALAVDEAKGFLCGYRGTRAERGRNRKESQVRGWGGI